MTAVTHFAQLTGVCKMAHARTVFKMASDLAPCKLTWRDLQDPNMTGSLDRHVIDAAVIISALAIE